MKKCKNAKIKLSGNIEKSIRKNRKKKLKVFGKNQEISKKVLGKIEKKKHWDKIEKKIWKNREKKDEQKNRKKWENKKK